MLSSALAPEASARPDSSLTSNLDRALALAAEGFYVLPLHWVIAPDKCSCEKPCGKNRGKHPITTDGFYSATRDADQIRDWWSAAPQANIGIRTGTALPGGGFLGVIDHDPRNDDAACSNFFALLHELGPGAETVLNDTRATSTGGGGIHFYLRTLIPIDCENGFRQAIDFKGFGGYVLAPGSRTAGEYAWSNDFEILEMPDALERALLIAANAKPKRKAGPRVEPDPFKDDEERERRMRNARTYLERTANLSIEGQGGRNVFFGVCAVLTRSMRLPDDACMSLVQDVYNPRLVAAGTTPWDEDEIRERLESARTTSSVEPGIVSGPVTIPKSTNPEIAAMGGRVQSSGTDPTKPDATTTNEGKRKGATRTVVANILSGGAPEWENVLWFDVLKRKEMATNAPIGGEPLGIQKGLGLLPSDVSRIALWFDQNDISVSNEAVRSGIDCAVAQRPRNLIVEYLNALEPATASETLDTFATKYLGCADEFSNVLVKKTLVAAARRARCHGAGHRGMLILKGPQNCGKTQALRILGGDWYHTTGNTDLTQDMPLYACVGNLIVEVEELSAISKKDADALKTLISRGDDTLNLKFIKDPQPFKRTFVFIGTTNKETFLNDPSGNTRFWVVEVGRIDLAGIEAVRDRVWAEADFLARQGLSTFLEPREESELRKGQSKFNRESPLMSRILPFILDKEPEAVDAQYIYEQCIRVEHFSSKTPSPQEQDAIENCLQILGARKVTGGTRPRIGGKDGRRPSSYWVFTPAALAKLASEHVDENVDEPRPSSVQTESKAHASN